MAWIGFRQLKFSAGFSAYSQNTVIPSEPRNLLFT
jgi:hypothetical protein